MQPNFHAYGLGWMLRDYRGKKTGVSHGHARRVRFAVTTLVPELKLGVVVLTNQEETGRARRHRMDGARPLPGRAADRLGDGVFGTWPRCEAAEGEAEVKKAAGKRNADSRPSLPLAAYAGPLSRRLVRRRGASRSMAESSRSRSPTRPQLTGDLEHWQYDTFVARWRDRTLNADAFVTFSLGAGRRDRSGEDGAGVAADGFQLRFSGSGTAARDDRPEITSREKLRRSRPSGRFSPRVRERGARRD